MYSVNKLSLSSPEYKVMFNTIHKKKRKLKITSAEFHQIDPKNIGSKKIREIGNFNLYF